MLDYEAHHRAQRYGAPRAASTPPRILVGDVLAVTRALTSLRRRGTFLLSAYGQQRLWGTIAAGVGGLLLMAGPAVIVATLYLGYNVLYPLLGMCTGALLFLAGVMLRGDSRRDVYDGLRLVAVIASGGVEGTGPAGNESPSAGPFGGPRQG